MHTNFARVFGGPLGPSPWLLA